MQELYLAPTECATLLPGPNSALPFLPKSTSSSSHQGNPSQTEHSTNRAPSPRTMQGGIHCVPAGAWSSDCPLPCAKASAFACLGRHFSTFCRPGSQVQQSALPAGAVGQGGWQDSLNHPSSRISASRSWGTPVRLHWPDRTRYGPGQGPQLSHL